LVHFEIEVEEGVVEALVVGENGEGGGGGGEGEGAVGGLLEAGGGGGEGGEVGE